ncbi:hypothetical protein KEM52_004642, partial [Ascosphaera acerosa]
MDLVIPTNVKRDLTEFGLSNECDIDDPLEVDSKGNRRQDSRRFRAAMAELAIKNPAGWRKKMDGLFQGREVVQELLTKTELYYEQFLQDGVQIQVITKQEANAEQKRLEKSKAGLKDQARAIR